MRRLVDRARCSHETTAGEALRQMLERRLDNVVFRLGLASTRCHASSSVMATSSSMGAGAGRGCDAGRDPAPPHLGGKAVLRSVAPEGDIALAVHTPAE